MSPRSSILAGAALSALAGSTWAGCAWIDTPIASPYDLAPPGPALLESPSAGAAPVDPRFADALTAYAASLRRLRGARGAEGYPELRAALRALADAVALVPAGPRLRQPAFDTANEVRVTVALMATTYENDVRAQTAHARRALEAVARLLHEVAAGDYAGAKDVLARTRALDATVQRAGADDPAQAEPRLRAALEAAERALEAMLRARIDSGER